MELVLEHKDQKPNPPLHSGGGATVLITPPLDESFWLYRVMVSESQAVVGFPKFGIVGIGFALEDDDWNTNLPSSLEAQAIFDHISANKGDASIPDDRCIEAIRMVQAGVAADKAQS